MIDADKFHIYAYVKVVNDATVKLQATVSDRFDLHIKLTRIDMDPYNGTSFEFVDQKNRDHTYYAYIDYDKDDDDGNE